MSILQTPAVLDKVEPGIAIAVINESSVVTDTEIKSVVHALQVQVTRDFFPIWGINANLTFYPKGAAVPATSWQFLFLDDADQAGALGYHDLTSTGLPLAKIFCVTTVQDGGKWSVTASHEMMEMLVDPYLELCSFNQTGNTVGILYAYEVADPVEDDSSGYNVGGVRVSNFVYPEWFEADATGKVDFLGECAAPFTLLSNGYVSSFAVTPTTRGWTQTFGQQRAIADRMISKARLALRTKPKNERVRSTVVPEGISRAE
jgi:hypothetical protein